MPENSMKLASTNHVIRCIVTMGASCFQLKFFYLQNGKVLLQHTVDNEVSELARLTFFR